MFNEHRRMYSLIVSPVVSARLLIFDFSEFETRM